jgi:hypothetical protein
MRDSFMLRNKSGRSVHSRQSPQQNNFSYQALYLWTSFLLGMISLGIVIWNRRQASFNYSSVIPSAARDLHSSHFQEILRCAQDDTAYAWENNYAVTYSTPLILSALAYQLSSNSAASLLILSSWPLFFVTPTAAQYSNLQTALSEFRVNTYIPGQQLLSRISRLTNGELIITWTSGGQDGSIWGVYAQRYANNGTALGNEFRVNNFTQGDQSQSWVAALSDTSFVIVWYSFQDGVDYDVYARLFASDGSAISDEFLVNMQTNGNQVFPAVFPSDQGEFLVLWESDGQDGSGAGVFGRYYLNNYTAVSNEFQVNTYINDDQNWPSAVAINNNKWVITWHSKGQDNSSFGIYAQLFINNTIFLGSEFRVNQVTQNAQMYPVVIHFQNEFVVLFMSQGSGVVADDISNHAVYGRRFSDNGTALSDEFRISFWSLSQANKVSAAVLNQDYFVVIWKAYGENIMTNYDVYGRICHREGNCISSEFRINSNYASYSDSSGGQVTVLSNASFVVTYDGRGHDPDGSDGVYARIITLNDLKITLPISSPTPIPTPKSVSTSELTTSNVVIEVSNTSTKKATDSIEFSLSNNDPNLGAYIGGAAAGACAA